MNQREITFRPAKPVFEEGLVCGRHLDETAEGFFSIMLGKHAVKILAEAYTQTGHSYSYENVTFAEIDGEIVGMSLGFTAQQHRGFSDAPLRTSCEAFYSEAAELGTLCRASSATCVKAERIAEPQAIRG